MRISDWSSDVCSSDLKTYDDTLKSSDLLTAMGPGSVALSQQYIYPDGTSGIVTCETAYNFIRNGWSNYYAIAAPKIAAQFFPGIPVAQASTRLNNELGRASCREKVCQYV